jgi:hypothetical protein
MQDLKTSEVDAVSGGAASPVSIWDSIRQALRDYLDQM